MSVCKKCKQSLPQEAFSQIKRNNSTTYRLSCKSCEIKDAKARRWAKKNNIAHEPVPTILSGAQNPKETDPGFFVDDEWAKMPSDSDMLFYSTPFFDDIIENRKVLMTKVPKDD